MGREPRQKALNGEDMLNGTEAYNVVGRRQGSLQLPLFSFPTGRSMNQGNCMG